MQFPASACKAASSRLPAERAWRRRLRGPADGEPRFSEACRACPRLAAHLDGIRAVHPAYHARPVAPFGDDQPRLLVVGLDVIGDWLTEVNVTSPTCFREIQDQTGFDVSGMFIDALELRLKREGAGP